ncbi:MAG TPA: DUF6703 family protein [Pseudonocardiaceae bacterium]
MNRRGRRVLVPGKGPLSQVPPLVAGLAVTAVFAAGVITGGVLGALLLGALVLGVAALLAVAWPRLRPVDRGLRLLVLAILVAVTLAQLR